MERKEPHFLLVKMLHKKTYFLLFFGMLLQISSIDAQTIRYVKPSSSGTGDGTSWVNASADLQGMINASANADQVWVSAGTFYPTSTLDRSISFSMKEGVKIYGSFAGTETSLASRTLETMSANRTFLSGDIDKDNILNGNNSYHVIYNFDNGLTIAAVIDGFTIINGYANDLNKEFNGGGMWNFKASPTIRNCVFTYNYALKGGGIAHYGEQIDFFTTIISPLKIINCEFTNNFAGSSGGAIRCEWAEPEILNATFANNSATEGGAIYAYKSNSTLGVQSCTFSGNSAQRGGAMYNSFSDSFLNNCVYKGNNANEQAGAVFNERCGQLIYNCVFLGNNAASSGGGISNLNATATIVNCSFSGNNALFGGALVVATLTSGVPNTSISNSIIWGNSSGIGTMFGGAAEATYSNIQGAYTGTGNIDIDPEFISPPAVGLGTSGDLHLQSSSPSINSGSNIPVNFSTDLEGNPRIYNSCLVDMGAYEYQGNGTYFPPASGITSDNGLNFDGTNDFIEIRSADILNCTNVPLAVSDAITVEYWFKGTNMQSAVRFQNGSNYIVSGWNGSGTTANKHILSNDGATNGIAAGAAATDGNWHHIAFTWQKGTVNGFKSYLDGNLVEQKNAGNTNLPAISSGMFLGALNGTSEFMNGSLDEVRVWNVARTQAEIQAGMCGSITPPQSGLLINYKFDHGTANGTNTGINILQNSANTNLYRGTLQNFALVNISSNWVSPKAPQIVRYVKQSGTGAGTSWADASGDLQAMIEICGVEQVWVAAGTYKPTTGSDRTISFEMKAGVKIYGGFPVSGNPVFADRNWNVNKTYLSGDLSNNDVISGSGNTLSISNNAENSYKVIVNDNNGLTTTNSVLDGFIIKGGNANGSFPNDRGGGMYNFLASPGLVNVSYVGNYGSFGGGIFNDNSSPGVNDAVFSKNNSGQGGGMFNAFSSAPTITNSTFSGNKATTAGGGMYITNVSTSTVKNSIFWENSSVSGADIGVGGTINISNSLLQLFQSQYTTGYTIGTGMVYGVNPLFMDAANDNFALQAQSCAINTGTNAAVPVGVTTDFLGSPRFYNSGTVDLGAYEFQGEKQQYMLPALTTNNALSFDGVNDFVSITTSDFVNCTSSGISLSDALTIEYWFKGSNPQSAVRFQDSQNYIVAGWGTGTFKHILSNDGGINGIAVGTAATDGNWHHIAMTWQRNTANGFKSYLDGILVEQRQSSNTALPSFSSGMFLGAFGGNSEFTNGTIDEVRVWNVTRTQAEIQANMCGLNLPQNGLILNYKFDHGTVGSGNVANNQLLNSAATSTFLGTLNNFALAGANSNWVETNNACTVNFPVISFSGFTKNSFCAGSSFNLTFTATGNFNAGNSFQAMLSDINGDFTSGQIIGTSNTVGSIPCTIPANIIFGSNYRIKVLSSFPSIGDNTNLENLTVHPKDHALMSPANDYSAGISVFKASETITATNANSGTANVSYQAGKSILLSPGFQVSNSGAVFKAEIKACD